MNPVPATPTTRDIVTALGGPPAVCAWLGCKPAAISNWHRLGFAEARHGALLELAAAKTPPVALTNAMLRAASALARTAAASPAQQGHRRGRNRTPNPKEPDHGT